VAAATGLLVILVLVVVVAPPRFTTDRDFKTGSEELTAQSAVRTTLLQGFAALTVLSRDQPPVIWPLPTSSVAAKESSG
jgi:hypothetical protein